MIDGRPFPAYWFVPGRLMAGQYPGHYEPGFAREKIRWLLAQGVRRFVDLTEAGEATWEAGPLVSYDELVVQEAKTRGMAATYRRFPVRDLDVPPHRGMVRILDYLDDAVARDEPAFVHCLGGRGRTGTVIACYFLRHAKEHLAAPADESTLADRALDKIVDLRLANDIPDPYDSPQTEVQFEFVRGWGEPQGGAVGGRS